MDLHTGKFLVAVLLVGAFAPYSVSGQVVITEVMYDLKSGADGGREWVEVYNAGPTEVPLATFKLFENGTAHKITSVSGGHMLPAGAYAIIADNATNYKTNWPSYGGLLFDSAFSLSNDGEAIALRNASSTDLDTAVYHSSIGGAGDGNSLNRSVSGATFVARSPSPGAAMSAEAIVPLKAPEKIEKISAKTKSVASAKVVAEPASDTLEEPMAEDVSVKGDDVPQVASAQVAAAGSTSSGSSVWWIGALVIAAFAASSLFLARRLSKTEWDIEEIEETG